MLLLLECETPNVRPQGCQRASNLYKTCNTLILRGLIRLFQQSVIVVVGIQDVYGTRKGGEQSFYFKTASQTFRLRLFLFGSVQVLEWVCRLPIPAFVLYRTFTDYQLGFIITGACFAFPQRKYCRTKCVQGQHRTFYSLRRIVFPPTTIELQQVVSL